LCSCLHEIDFIYLYQHFQVNPYLEAIIELNPDVLGIAMRLDEERGRGKTRGRLHGIPVFVKDVGCRRISISGGLLTVEEYGNKGQNADDSGLLGLAWKRRTKRFACSFTASRRWRDYFGTRQHERVVFGQIFNLFNRIFSPRRSSAQPLRSF